MRVLLLLLLPLVRADSSKDTQNFQNSRTGNGEEEIKRFYGSHSAKIGGNLEVTHNMDTLPKRHMKGLAMTVSSLLGRDPRAIGTGTRLDESECLEYSRRFCNTACAQGGTSVITPGKYPHMAAVGWRKRKEAGFSWLCGGSLLSENYVLTAAQCNIARDDTLFSNRPDTVRLGELDFSKDDTELQDIPIESIIVHPEFKAGVKYHDLALLKLATPARLTHLIRPVCLWQNETITRTTGHSGQASGWGKTSRFGNRSEVLQEVEISFFTNEKCRESYGQTRKMKQGMIPEQLCAGPSPGGRDICQTGFGGGPLTVSEENDCFACVHRQVGITSFGKPCGSTDPDVYTRISSYLDWIEGVVWPATHDQL